MFPSKIQQSTGCWNIISNRGWQSCYSNIVHKDSKDSLLSSWEEVILNISKKLKGHKSNYAEFPTVKFLLMRLYEEFEPCFYSGPRVYRHKVKSLSNYFIIVVSPKHLEISKNITISQFWSHTKLDCRTRKHWSI